MHYFDSMQLNACIYHAILYWHASVIGATNLVVHSADQCMQVRGCIRGIGVQPNTFLVQFLFPAMISLKSFSMRLIDWQNELTMLIECIFTMLHSLRRNLREKSLAKSMVSVKFRPETGIFWPFYDFIIYVVLQ